MLGEENSIMRKCNKNILSIFLAASMMLTLAGCGGNTPGTGDSDTGEGAGIKEQGSAPAAADGETAMGRYVEEEIDLSSQLSEAASMCMLNDGRIVIMDGMRGMLVSEDQGSTWNTENPEWLTAMLGKNIYIGTMTMAPDGTAAVVYNPDNGVDGYHPVLKLVLPDGTDVPIEMDLTEDDMYVRQVITNEDGRIFANTFGSIFEVYRDGSSDRILTPDINVSWVWAAGSLIFMDNDREGIDSPVIYDLDAGEYIEDDVLVEFTTDNYYDRLYNGTMFCTMYLLPGEDDAIYVAGAKGIHRHAIGGNMVEQIVDGNLSLLSNPNYVFVSMLKLEGDAFIALFDNRKVVKFTYDPDAPSTPENVVTVYSLRDNEDIRQAISAFQIQNPDTYVSYIIGMSAGDSVTRDDAVKKLNTEIMAGTGPDLIVLDDMPLNSYVNKGMLLDISDYLAQYSANDPLFDNVIEAMKFDGAAYVVPGSFSVPLMAAKESYLSNVTNLSDIADIVEMLRGEHPGEDIIGICDERDLMKRFAGTSAPNWINANGELDRDGIGEYLKQCKRIYSAQMDSLDANVVKRYEEKAHGQEKYGGFEVTKIDWSIQSDIMDFIGGSGYLLSGWTTTYYTYEEVLSVNYVKGFEDIAIVPMQGQCSNVFKPQTILGINSSSERIDLAKKFMDTFLSADVQSEYSGFPVNRGGYDIQFTPEEAYLGPGNEYIYLGISNDDGAEVSYIIYWPTDEQIAAFKEQLASVDTAYVPDTVLEEAIFDNGSIYIRDRWSLEDALDEIAKAVAIYMAE